MQAAEMSVRPPDRRDQCRPAMDDDLVAPARDEIRHVGDKAQPAWRRHLEGAQMEIGLGRRAGAQPDIPKGATLFVAEMIIFAGALGFFPFAGLI